jgi:LCP family protein required for cell wall assembly
MADERDPAPPPEYRVYRSRRRLFGRDGDDDLGVGPRGPRRDGDDGRDPGDRPGEPPPPRRRRRPGVWRILRILLAVLVAWVLFSLVLFLVSAQIQRQGVSDAAGEQLGGAGFTLTSPNTILVLGSDARTKENAEPGSSGIGQPSRSDTILLMRAGGGASQRLSIPRDTVVDIPGFGRNKINAAYALGGPALAVKTVEQYLGIEVNHLVEVNFENFPDFIDALGGIDLRTGCVVSRINGGYRNGGYTLRLKAGENHLDGEAALALARTRKNECRPSENDLTRARRQQKILSAIKSRLLSPVTFVRLPLVSWAAPKAVRSDMAGPSLLGLFGAVATSGSPTTEVLKPDGAVTLPDGGAGLSVSDAEKARKVRRFLAD